MSDDTYSIFSGITKGDEDNSTLKAFVRKVLKKIYEDLCKIIDDVICNPKEQIKNALTKLKIATAFYFRSLMALKYIVINLLSDYARHYRHVHDTLNLLSLSLMSMIACVYHPSTRFSSKDYMLTA